MATKTTVGISILVAVLALAAGIGIDRTVLHDPDATVSKEEYQQLADEKLQLAAELEVAMTEISALKEKERDGLARVQELESEVSELRALYEFELTKKPTRSMNRRPLIGVVCTMSRSSSTDWSFARAVVHALPIAWRVHSLLVRGA